MKHRNCRMKHQRMWFNCLLVVFLNANHLVDSFSFEVGSIDPEEEWRSTESLTLSADDYGSDAFMPQFRVGAESVTQPPPLKLPESVRIPASKLYKELFAPGKGSGPVPPLVQSILLPSAVKAATPVSGATKTVEALCHLERVYVRVLRSFFTNPGAWKYLKLGTCAVNKATNTHYYFLYYLKGCGITREENADRVIYTNTLSYQPVVTGPIVRELPFTMPILCRYAKFRRSYQLGFFPKITGGTVHKSLQTQTLSTIDAVDASWNLLVDGESFVLGKPACFEAKGPSSVTGKRLYLNSCFVTTSSDPQATEKYSVVENYGCLVDSKNSILTKFYTSDNKMTVRLCVAAFLFKDMVSPPESKTTMFMHCELDVGPETPTTTAKSCSYDAKTKKWTELYGEASVCSCCATTCSALPVAAGWYKFILFLNEVCFLTDDVLFLAGKSMVTSKSWDLKLDKKIEESIPEFSLAGHDDFELFWESDDN